MKALQLADFGRMEIVDLQAPEPGPGEVLVRIVATGVCGSDLHGFTGENGRRVPGQVMGHESAGTVAGLGAGVDGLSVGDTVTFNPVVVAEEDVEAYAGREQLSPNKRVVGVTPDIVASFAQRIVVPARNVVPLPPEMPIELGALVEPLAVAVHGVRNAGVQPDDAVVVLGGGPIGQSTVLALQMIGVSRIAVTEVVPSRRALVEELGVTAVDAGAEDAEELVARALGGPADRAIDAVGIEATLRSALRATRIGGTVCLVGMGAPTLTLDAFLISTQERSLVGSFTYSARDFADAAAWIGTAPPQARALISRQVPLAQGPQEFSALAAGDGTPGKVLIRLDEEQ
ncbi:zinc-containing alcohol dehydrogenase [Streptomonospora alba]|uniref:Zinc-containing alcohol dehydrogenase n=1 Tax=Streptomonospora alba TaxID=183763 RepID=A0A0C2JEA9_9ACTN|nr:alcohol dehydrogenase catalytic domain-containing protein [Streptomonospora alba]KIH99661.1 zinc-containing alcohol dehydrogenase [Streptomonospora alba]